jgi:hypothetical protein
MANAAFHKTKTYVINKFDLKLRKKQVNYHNWCVDLYAAVHWTLRKVYQKHLENTEVWCCRRIEISWTNRVENEILHRVTVERNILHTVHRMKASWIGHFLPRKCLLRHVIKGKMERRIEVKERQVRRRKQVLDDF